MPKKNGAESEEVPTTYSLRRSTRRVETPGSPSTPSKTRGSSVTKESEAKPAPRTRRVLSASEEPQKVATPVRRGRRPSVTDTDKEEAEKPKPVRARRSSATEKPDDKETEKVAPVRTRRGSANVELEVENDPKTPAKPKGRQSVLAAENSSTVASPATRGRRKSVTQDEEQSKPAPRRGRKTSTDSATSESAPSTGRLTRRSSTDSIEIPVRTHVMATRRSSINREEPETKEEESPPSVPELPVRVTPLKKRKIIEQVESELDLSVINENDLDGSKNGDSSLKEADDNSGKTDVNIFESEVFEESEILMNKSQGLNASPPLNKASAASRGDSISLTAVNASPKLNKSSSPKVSPSTKRSLSPSCEAISSPRKSPRLSEKLSGKSTPVSSPTSSPSRKTRNIFNVSISDSQVDDKQLNTSTESSCSNKENIKTDNQVLKVLARVSNVFKPNQKEYSFTEPMDVDGSVIYSDNNLQLSTDLIAKKDCYETGNKTSKERVIDSEITITNFIVQETADTVDISVNTKSPNKETAESVNIVEEKSSGPLVAAHGIIRKSRSPQDPDSGIEDEDRTKLTEVEQRRRSLGSRDRQESPVTSKTKSPFRNLPKDTQEQTVEAGAEAGANQANEVDDSDKEKMPQEVESEIRKMTEEEKEKSSVTNQTIIEADDEVDKLTDVIDSYKEEKPSQPVKIRKSKVADEEIGSQLASANQVDTDTFSDTNDSNKEADEEEEEVSQSNVLDDNSSVDSEHAESINASKIGHLETAATKDSEYDFLLPSDDDDLNSTKNSIPDEAEVEFQTNSPKKIIDNQDSCPPKDEGPTHLAPENDALTKTRRQEEDEEVEAVAEKSDLESPQEQDVTDVEFNFSLYDGRSKEITEESNLEKSKNDKLEDVLKEPDDLKNTEIEADSSEDLMIAADREVNEKPENTSDAFDKDCKEDDESNEVVEKANNLDDSKTKQPTKSVLSEATAKKLQSYIDSKMAEASEESGSELEEEESDRDYNEFVDDMAEEGEEDTPSEDSNQIIERGESIGSSDSDIMEEEDDYEEEDSFICDDEPVELLSGDEYDLDNEKTTQKSKRSRIVPSSDLEGEDYIKVKIKSKSPSKSKSRIIRPTESSSDEEHQDDGSKEPEVNESALQDKVPKDDATVISIDDSHISESAPEDKVSKDDNTAILINDSLNPTNESIVAVDLIAEVSVNQSFSDQIPKKDTKDEEVNKSVLDTTKEPPVSESFLLDSVKKHRRKSSLTIHENIFVDGTKDQNLPKKISSLVESFCSTLQQGEIALNLSLDFEDRSPDTSSNHVCANEPSSVEEQATNNVPEPIRKDVEVQVQEASREEATSSQVTDLREVLNEKCLKRRSKSLETLKLPNKKAKRARQKSTPEEMAQDLKISSFSIMNQLVTDVKNRPKRLIKPSKSLGEAISSWTVTKLEKLGPSTSSAAKQEKHLLKPKFHPKDFKNQLLSDDKRVKRVDTKTLLKKKGAL